MWTALTSFAVVPADLATIYHFNPLFSAGITGQGQTIALIGDRDLDDPSEWTTFRETFGLDAYTGGSLVTLHPGGCSDPGVNGDDLESAIDVGVGQRRSAQRCPPTGYLRRVQPLMFGGLIAVQNLLNQREVPPIVSMSYGECEAQVGATGNAAYKAVYLQAVLEGVSVFVAAGDSGAAMCDVTLTSRGSRAYQEWK